MTLKLSVLASIMGFVTAPNDIATVRADFNKRRSVELRTGVGPGEANLVFSDRRTIAASGNDDLDLAGGLSDPFGAALTFAKVKAILVMAAPENTNAVLVGGAPANGFEGPFMGEDHQQGVAPGGTLLITAPKDGWPVTAATADLLRIANGGAGSAVTYDIVLVGTNA